MFEQRPYRGMRTDGGGWAHGWLKYNPFTEKAHIEMFVAERKCLIYEVDPATVTQSTGIGAFYGGDKVRVQDGDGFAIGEAEWDGVRAQWRWISREVEPECLTIFVGRSLPLCEILDEHSRFHGEIIPEDDTNTASG